MSRDFQKARWIWDEGEEDPQNYHLMFRREFECEEFPARAFLHVTADSRYILWVNGERLGDGPVRGFTERWFYDTYDVSSRIHPGRNAIAVLVRHFGLGTFQYIPARGGMIAELEAEFEGGAERRCVVATDESWAVRQHTGYVRNTSRISCQQGQTEYYDARAVPEEWTSEGYDSSGWERAVSLGAAGCDPWTTLEPRDIPFLTDEPWSPVRIRSARRVRPYGSAWAFDLRPYLLPGRMDANPKRMRGIVATTLSVEEPCDAEFLFHASASSQLVVNGEPVTERASGYDWWLGGPCLRARLREGKNLLLFPVDGTFHEWSFSVIARSAVELDPEVPQGSVRFAVIGPFSDDEESALTARIEEEIWEGLAREGRIHPVAPEAEYPTHLLNLILSSREEPGSPEVMRPEACLSANDDTTVIRPDPDAADVEIVYEFERLLAGELEFEVEAPEGAILDWYGFEAYLDSGEIDYTWGLDNSLRYVTKEGRQRYRSIQHRGLRYLVLVVRNLEAPLRIRGIELHVRTYPSAPVGEFRCNDLVLQRSYEISRWTTRMCSDDTFVDCPTYEQTFWVGDARNEGAAAFMLFGSRDLSRRCLRLAAASLGRSPVVESQVPSSWENILTTWSFLWVLACEEYYRYTGEREFLDEIYPYMLRQFSFCRDRLVGKDGLLWSPWWNMLDWAPMDTPSNAAVTHLNAWFVEACRRTARVSELVGKKSDATEIRRVAKSVGEAMNDHLWNEERQAYVDCRRASGDLSGVVSEQTNTICYLCDIAPPGRRERIEEYVAASPEDFVKTVSPFMVFFKMEALAKAGRYREILGLIRDNWGYMLEKDSTTCWENMPGWERHRWTRSHCHAWSAAPAYFLPAVVLGITPGEPGFRRVRIEPEPVDLEWAEGTVPTPAGPVRVRWESSPRRFSLDLELPREISAEVRLPLPASLHARLDIEGRGLERTSVKNGLRHFEVEPGARLSVAIAR